MDPTTELSPPRPTCSCTCLCCGSNSTPSLAWRQSLKRKLDQIQQQQRSRHGDVSGTARVELEIEAAALRETLARHQNSIQDLIDELEEERAATASATSEAMSMILRLQREKAEAQMEFRQFKRYSEEKMSHDQEEIIQLEELLFQRDQAVQSLTCEIHAYKHKLMSYGFGPDISDLPQTPNTSTALNAAASAFDYYPPLRCKTKKDANEEVEKYAFGETPKDQILNIEQRILQMERMSVPGSSHEKCVVAFSPVKMRDVKVPEKEEEEEDRVYTVDMVHCDESTPEKRDKGSGGEEEEIKRLYARLQALEADRETMRQTMMAMGTDKAQLVLLKEIAQHLCKEETQVQGMQMLPQRKIVRKPSFVTGFSIFAAIKVI